jgi:ankyrin repeat protein/L-ascorbate metabolism protein UlaG (beta-lactamase superfamily)
MFKLVIPIVVAAAVLCGALPASGGEIHRAIEAGDVALVKQILEQDPSALHQLDDSRFREPPLLVAAAVGNVEIARLLLEAGADIEAGDVDNSTALGVAAIHAQGEMVAFLIEQGADVNRRDRKADCPLSFAVYGRDESIIRQLLDAGADLYFRNPNGESLLHIACSRGVTELVTYLLDHGAELELKSRSGGTALGYAAMSGQPEMVRLLIDKGANPNPAPPGDPSPLIYTSWRNHVECARVLLERGAEVDHTTGGNNTALSWAADRASPEMVALLLEHGAQVNHVNDEGETALVRASTYGYADRVELLLAAGADPNLGTDGGGRNALQLAALGGHLEVTHMLLANGADRNARTPLGETPLQLARYYGHEDLIPLLAKKGTRGGGLKTVDRSLAALGGVGDKEAVIWFLGHSGWAVKTTNHVLIFDYFTEGQPPAAPALCNGYVNPAEIAGYKVAVFATHFHGDHFTPTVFEWRDRVPDITYFMGLEPQDAPPYVFLPERMEEVVGDLKITTIHSTDAGVGVVVEVDGLTIFHPGDHANGRIGLMDEFTDEIDWLAEKGIRPDICFMGIRGCSLGRPDEVKEGIYYTLRTLQPDVFIPMHAQARGHVYREFVAECQQEFAKIQMVAPDNRGDHFVYSRGKITDPRREGVREARAD